MNIIVKPYGSKSCYCRPDTTWERENKDFYSPECVNEVYYTPVVFARVAKAGKCIGGKFVQRYYDGIGCGVLLYGDGISHIDKSSILPLPLYDPMVFDDEKGFEINEDCIAPDEAGEWRRLLEDTICRSSELISLRIGDYVAVELEPAKVLARRPDTEAALKGRFCENDIFDFRVIL
jgi:hypothetical protein